MSPKPVITTPKHQYSATCPCDTCTATFIAKLRASRALQYGYTERPRMRWRSILAALAFMLIALAIASLIVFLAFSDQAHARPTQVQPVAAPQSLLKARHACPNSASLVECRSALVRAYRSVEWQRTENLKLAREMLGKVTDWTCIHGGEGAWNANTGNGYHGGLQMDWPFMRTYGRDMLAKHNGPAELWTPREQIIVAQRAYAQGRGYAPWPQTSRMCGLR